MIVEERGENIQGNKYFVFCKTFGFGRDSLEASFDYWDDALSWARRLVDELEEEDVQNFKKQKGHEDEIYEPKDWVYILDTEEVCIWIIWSIRRKNRAISKKFDYDQWFLREFERYPSLEEYYADLPECFPNSGDSEYCLTFPNYVPVYTDTREPIYQIREPIYP